ncbi:unnamed protein product, partial [Laminaria digitata]
MCTRGENCNFVHSRDAAAEGYQPKRFADERPAKRLAPGTKTSPRPTLPQKPPGFSHQARIEAAAGVRGRRAVQDFWQEEGASSASGGGGGGGGSSSFTGDRGSSPRSWQP